LKDRPNVRYATDVAWVRSLLLALVVAGPAVAQPAVAQPGDPPSATPAPAAPAPDASAKPVASSLPRTAKPAPPAPVKIRVEAPAPVDTSNLRTAGVEEIIERLESRATLLRKGDRNGANVELNHLLSVRSSLGNVNVPLASSVLLQESRAALAAGDAQAARVAAESAASLSPDMIPAHWARFNACVALADGCALGAMTEAVMSRFRGFRNQVATLTDLLGISILTFLGLALLYTLLQIARYGRSATHDIAEKLPAWAGSPVAACILGLLLLAPLTVGVGLVPTVAIWLAGTMLYQTPRERAVSMGMMVSLAIVPLFLYAASPLLMVHGSTVDDLASLASEAYAPGAEARLTVEAEKSNDYEPAFLLARRAWAVGDLVTAERWYRAALTSRPSDAAAHNNLGMVLFQMKNRDGARAEWEAAGSSRIEPLLNAASIDLDAGKFEVAKQKIDQATRMDPERTRHFSEADTDPGSRLLAIPFDQTVLWDRMLGAVGTRDPEPVVAGVWARLGGIVPWLFFPPIALVLGVLAMVLAKKSDAFSAPCPKCGQPAHRKAKNGYCAQCQTIYLKAVAVEPAMRLQKEDAIRRRQVRLRWSERALSLFAGAAQIIEGRPIEGALMLGAVTAIAVHWWWMERLSIHPWATGLGVGGWHVGVALLICGALAFISSKRVN